MNEASWERVVWIDRFPMLIGDGPHGRWVASPRRELTPYGTSAGALCEALNTTHENRASDLQGILSGEGFFCEGASVLPLLWWGKADVERVARRKATCKGYFDHVAEDELWVCQSFDDDDFVVLPYGTLLAIVNVALAFKKHGVLPAAE